MGGIGLRTGQSRHSYPPRSADLAPDVLCLGIDEPWPLAAGNECASRPSGVGLVKYVAGCSVGRIGQRFGVGDGVT
jgi:hypothetical protein